MKKAKDYRVAAQENYAIKSIKNTKSGCMQTVAFSYQKTVEKWKIAEFC